MSKPTLPPGSRIRYCPAGADQTISTSQSATVIVFAHNEEVGLAITPCGRYVVFMIDHDGGPPLLGDVIAHRDFRVATEDYWGAVSHSRLFGGAWMYHDPRFA